MFLINIIVTKTDRIIFVVNESTSICDRHKKKKTRKETKNKQRYVWHVVSCVAEKKHRKKERTIGSVPLHIHFSSIMSRTRSVIAEKRQ
jgi:hypothetical protein